MNSPGNQILPAMKQNTNRFCKLQAKDSPTAIVRTPPQFANDKFCAIYEGIEFDFILNPTGSIRYIGINQGINNFALSAVDKHLGQPTKLVYAKLVTDLELA